MSDVIFIAATVAFFCICVLYVQWCDRIIGPDEFTQVSAPLPDRPGLDLADSPHAESSIDTAVSA